MCSQLNGIAGMPASPLMMSRTSRIRQGNGVVTTTVPGISARGGSLRAGFYLTRR